MPHKAKPLRWLYELLGPSILQAYIDVFGSTYSDSSDPCAAADGGAPLHLNTGVNTGANGCIHEDGGRNAVFEEIQAGEQVLNTFERVMMKLISTRKNFAVLAAVSFSTILLLLWWVFTLLFCVLY